MMGMRIRNEKSENFDIIGLDFMDTKDKNAGSSEYFIS
jgi:hypothetical protein